MAKRPAPWFPPTGFITIAILAAANTALVNDGLARQGLLPAVLGHVDRGGRRPPIAIGTLFVTVLPMAAILLLHAVTRRARGKAMRDFLSGDALS